MYCKCGCGQITPVAKRNRHHLGHRKGEHIDYCKGHAVRGRKRPPLTENQKQKMSETRRANGLSRGANNPNWKGGRTALTARLRNSWQYRTWRTAVYERDGYTCQHCGAVRGPFNADHIEPMCVILQRHGITTVEAALTCAELWDVTNGRTLCEPCHEETDSYGWLATNNYIRKQFGNPTKGRKRRRS